MTSGGILGEIAEVQKDQFLLKVANNVQIAISRSAVAQVITPAADAAADTKAEVTKKCRTARAPSPFTASSRWP